MSLEDRITELTEAVEKLTAAMGVKAAACACKIAPQSEAFAAKIEAEEAKATPPKSLAQMKAEEPAPKADTAIIPPTVQENAAPEPKGEPSEVTLADVKPVFLEFVKVKTVPAAQVLLKKYGADLLSKVPAEKLAALLAEMKACLSGAA